MTRILFSLGLSLALLVVQTAANAQCCGKSFPYQFCDGHGNVKSFCSDHPCAGPNPPASGGPWKRVKASAIPNCIELGLSFTFSDPNTSFPHHVLDLVGDVINVLDPSVEPGNTTSAADDDANTALGEWLSVCHGSEEGSCCIQVNLITTRQDWVDMEIDKATGQVLDIMTTLATTHQKIGASSTGNCTLEPCASGFTTDVNYTPDWRLQIPNPTADDWPDPDDPTVGYNDYYDGLSSPLVDPSTTVFSFQQLMEHEIGHWFGLDEANAATGNGSCQHTDMVMSTDNNNPDGDGIDLTADDKCYFAQLYCPACCIDASVLQPKASSTGANSFQVFPNPASGLIRLDFDIAKNAYVTLSIYDLLGNQVASVSEGDQSEGQYSEAIDVSRWPSGSYFCVLETAEETKTVRLTIRR